LPIRGDLFVFTRSVLLQFAVFQPTGFFVALFGVFFNLDREVIMKKVSIVVGLAVFVFAAPLVSAAENAAPATLADGAKNTQPNDQGDWKGDNITLRSDATKFKSTDPNDATDYFAPDGAVLDVAVDDRKTDKITVKFRKGTLDGSNACADPSFFSCAFSRKQTTRDLTSHSVVEEHGVYTADKAAIESFPHSRRGYTFGALLVPFKYYSSDKSFTGASTIGTYIGYKFQDNRGSFTPILSVGWVPSIKVPLSNGTGTVDRSGLSLATGVIFSVDKGTGIQLGVLAGQDRLGNNAAAPYAQEGKWWLSISVGFKFI
jgi:hypothetical protein